MFGGTGDDGLAGGHAQPNHDIRLTQPACRDRLDGEDVDGPKRFRVPLDEVIPVVRRAVGAGLNSFFHEDVRRGIFMKQLETAVFPPNHPRWVEIEDVVDQALEEAIYGRKTPEEALAHGAQAIQGLLNREE